MQVKAIRAGSINNIETKINEVLSELKEFEVVDIKYSTSYNDSSVVYSAIIIYKSHL